MSDEGQLAKQLRETLSSVLTPVASAPVRAVELGGVSITVVRIERVSLALHADEEASAS